MDYFNSFDVSASGMAVQRLMLETVALNLANANTTQTVEGGPYRPLAVMVREKNAADFARYMESPYSLGATVQAVNVLSRPPRLVHEPGHPDADGRGFVAYPAIDPVAEMVTLVESVRAYEANVRAVNAAKEMALRALEIGNSNK
jgi:flagellar basal-body rod protein FlgC